MNHESKQGVDENTVHGNILHDLREGIRLYVRDQDREMFANDITISILRTKLDDIKSNPVAYYRDDSQSVRLLALLHILNVRTNSAEFDNHLFSELEQIVLHDSDQRVRGIALLVLLRNRIPFRDPTLRSIAIRFGNPDLFGDSGLIETLRAAYADLLECKSSLKRLDSLLGLLTTNNSSESSPQLGSGTRQVDNNDLN